MSNDNPRASLIERAAEIYDFGAALRGRDAIAPMIDADVVEAPLATAEEALRPAEPIAGATTTPRAKAPASSTLRPASVATIDRLRLQNDGFIVPEAPVSTLAEEFRLVKRQLLLRAGSEPGPRTAKDRMILVCSAQPNEGKTFCAVNLALSLASERDSEVLLVDADVAKPGVLATLGLQTAPGLIDAIAEPTLDVERLIIATDIPKLSILPAGTATHNDTELLSSARAAEIIAALATANERRIVILDSAPALAASPASVLAHRVGRVLMIVRADRTKESDLQEAIALLDGCDDISLLLNGASFFGSNRTYGSYYGSDQS